MIRKKKIAPMFGVNGKVAHPKWLLKAHLGCAFRFFDKMCYLEKITCAYVRKLVAFRATRGCSMGKKMSIRNQAFSAERGLETLLFIVERLDNPTIHEVLKIRYFADKLHLSYFGSFGSGDDYVAMQHGPVASNCYNLIKAARGDHSAYINPYFYKVVDGALTVDPDNKGLRAERKARLEYLTPAETKCIEEAISKFGGLDFATRTNISHDSAWKKAWKASGDGVGASLMSLCDVANTLENADEVVQFIAA